MALYKFRIIIIIIIIIMHSSYILAANNQISPDYTNSLTFP